MHHEHMPAYMEEETQNEVLLLVSYQRLMLTCIHVTYDVMKKNPNLFIWKQFKLIYGLFIKLLLTTNVGSCCILLKLMIFRHKLGVFFSHLCYSGMSNKEDKTLTATSQLTILHLNVFSSLNKWTRIKLAQLIGGSSLIMKHWKLSVKTEVRWENFLETSCKQTITD